MNSILQVVLGALGLAVIFAVFYLVGWVVIRYVFRDTTSSVRNEPMMCATIGFSTGAAVIMVWMFLMMIGQTILDLVK